MPSTSATTVASTSAVTTDSQPKHRRAKRRSSGAQRARSTSQSYNSLPTLSAIDHNMKSGSPVAVLASIRVLVLSHLAELEKHLSASELHLPSTEELKNKGEETVGEAKSWAHDTLEILRRIRSDVYAHLPDFPFDVPTLEEMLQTHFHDVSYHSLLDEIRAHIPDIPRMPDMDTMQIHIADMQTRFQDVRTHFSEMSADLSQPMNYLPVLSRHIDSLQARLASLSSSESCLISSTGILSTIIDKILSSDLVPAVLHRVDGHESTLEKAARDMKNALKKSLDGSELVTYVDLPKEWRNNPWVESGYRFIPLHRWPIILLSLFALHNETLNIHTHMIPLLHTALRSVFKASVSLDQPEKIYTAFAMLCLFSSVVWHTMSGCAHRTGMELCARVDYVGIGWLISASVGTVVYYGFSCHPDAAYNYLSLCLFTGILGSIFPFVRWFNGRKFKPIRVIFFLGMAFTGLAPLAHLSSLFGPKAVWNFIEPIVPSLISYLIGLLFYVTHVPERWVGSWSPRLARWTDWLGGGSHAIWHAFIVLAIYQHKWGMRALRDGVGGTGCL